MIDYVDLLAVVVRAASFVAALQAAGIALFVSMYRVFLRDSYSSLVKLGAASALAAAVLVLLSQALNSARMSGDLTGMWNGSLAALSWMSSSGAATAVRAMGAFAAFIGLKADNKRIAAFGSAFIIVSFALTGHTTMSESRRLLTPLLVTHIVVVVYWFGALPGLLAVAKHDRSTQVIALFSKYASYAVPLLALVGLLMAWMLLPNLAALTSPYGLALLGKIAGFLLLMPLAALNKLRYVPAMERGDAQAFERFGRTAKIEYVLVVAVLCVTATMTTLFSPE